MPCITGLGAVNCQHHVRPVLSGVALLTCTAVAVFCIALLASMNHQGPFLGMGALSAQGIIGALQGVPVVGSLLGIAVIGAAGSIAFLRGKRAQAANKEEISGTQTLDPEKNSEVQELKKEEPCPVKSYTSEKDPEVVQELKKEETSQFQTQVSDKDREMNRAARKIQRAFRSYSERKHILSQIAKQESIKVDLITHVTQPEAEKTIQTKDDFWAALKQVTELRKELKEAPLKTRKEHYTAEVERTKADLKIKRDLLITEEKDRVTDPRWVEIIPEILIHIFDQLGPRDLVTVGGVCKAWRVASEDTLLWKKHWSRIDKLSVFYQIPSEGIDRSFVAPRLFGKVPPQIEGVGTSTLKVGSLEGNKIYEGVVNHEIPGVFHCLESSDQKLYAIDWIYPGRRYSSTIEIIDSRLPEAIHIPLDRSKILDCGISSFTSIVLLIEKYGRHTYLQRIELSAWNEWQLQDPILIEESVCPKILITSTPAEGVVLVTSKSDIDGMKLIFFPEDNGPSTYLPVEEKMPPIDNLLSISRDSSSTFDEKRSLRLENDIIDGVHSPDQEDWDSSGEKLIHTISHLMVRDGKWVHEHYIKKDDDDYLDGCDFFANGVLLDNGMTVLATHEDHLRSNYGNDLLCEEEFRDRVSVYKLINNCFVRLAEVTMGHRIPRRFSPHFYSGKKPGYAVYPTEGRLQIYRFPSRKPLEAGVITRVDLPIS